MGKIPYGISNFQELREKKYLYVDKTSYIEILENEAPYLFFIRPRRFGKSLFLSMLENYYDILKKEKFDVLFSDLYIGHNQTPERNSYLVLPLSFASIITSEGKEPFIQSFNNNIVEAVRHFLYRYRSILADDVLPDDIKTAENAIRYMGYTVEEANQKVFILIDEYDNFANELIGSQNHDLYYQLLSSEGYVRTFYKTIKDGTTKSISRVIITGVSPIMLDDLTSGFNITKNLSLDKNINEMLGFTKQELYEVIKSLSLEKKTNTEQLIKDIELYYNGYLFSKDSNITLYNSNMVLYFLDAFIRENKYPETILDVNIKTDYKRLETLAFRFKDQELINELISEREITTELVKSFNLEFIYEKTENFASLLYYLGMLTIKEARLKKYVLRIPNYVIATIYWDYFLGKLSTHHKIDIKERDLSRAIEEMAFNNSINRLEGYLSKLLANLSNRDLISFDEKYIKMILMTLFYQDGTYIVNSEYEVEKGYIDIFLSKNKAYENSILYEWILELKYVKEEHKNKLEKIKESGIKQLHKYSDSIRLNNVNKALIIIKGKKDVDVVRVD